VIENTHNGPRDPFRDPAWRWARAGEDHRVGGPRDPWVDVARRYRRGLEGCRSAADRDRLATLLPAVSRAHAVWRAGGLRRAAVEARILAGEPLQDVARKAGMPLAVAGAYEALFYEVRTRLGATDFVASRLLPPAGPGDEVGAAVRHLGFVGGPVVLDVVIGGRATAARPGRPEDVGGFLGDQARIALLRDLAAALHGAADPATLTALVRAAAVALAGHREDPAARRSAIEMHIQAMLDDIPWPTGADGAAVVADRCPALAAADTLAAELRDDEVCRLAAGGEVAGMAEVAELKLPPPRRERVSPLTNPAKGPPPG
jgi:hypothetical protein